MATNRDVVVNITEQARVVSPVAFGKVLLISTEKEHEYKEYALSLELNNIKTTFGEESLTYKKALRFSQMQGAPDEIAIFGVDATIEGFDSKELTSALNALIQDHSNYFRVITTATEDEHKLAIARWANDNKKFARIQYNNTDFLSDYSELGQRLLLYTGDDYLDVAECVYAATKVPGAFNYKFKNYSSNFPGDKLTSEQIAAAEREKMGYFISDGVNNEMRNGYASNGKFMDDLESRVYVENLIQVKNKQLLKSEDKVSGGPIGLKQISAMILEALEECTSKNIIMKDINGQGDYTVNTDNAVFNKENGRWENIQFRYKFNDGTNGIDINGIVE